MAVSFKEKNTLISPPPPRILVTARMTGNIFSFGDPKLNLHLPLWWVVDLQILPYFGASWTHSEFIPSPKLNSSPLQSYRTPIEKANVFQAAFFQGASCENCPGKSTILMVFTRKDGDFHGTTVSFREGPMILLGVFFWSTNKNRTFEIFSQQSGGTPMGFIRRNNFHHVGFLYIVLREDVSKGLRLGVKGEG